MIMGNGMDMAVGKALPNPASYTCSLLIISLPSDSVAYEWGDAGGVVSYRYAHDRRPDTNEDVLSLGFITPAYDAILVRVDSHPDLNHDFLQMELVRCMLELNVFKDNEFNQLNTRTI
jgi:hypothetical protein